MLTRFVASNTVVAYTNPFSINDTFIPLAFINYIRIFSAVSKSNATEIEQCIGSEVDHFIYRVPTKNYGLDCAALQRIWRYNKELWSYTFDFTTSVPKRQWKVSPT